MKSAYMNSTTGRKRPSRAMPPPRPAKAFSLIGVPSTRPGNRSGRPRVAPLVPPLSRWTSSPMTTTRSSVSMRRPSTDGDRLHELLVAHLDVRLGTRDHCDVVELAQVAADTDLGERRVGPLRGANLPLAGLAAGHGLEQDVTDLLHHLLGASDRLLEVGACHQATTLEVAGGLAQRVALAPLALLLLGAVAEGAAGEGTVLMEEAVGVCLHEGRSVSGPHVRDGFSHRQVDREWIHAVDLPAGDVEARTATGETRLAGGLLDGGGDGVPVVLDEEADRKLPGCGEVERLQRGSDVDRTVAEVGHRHRVRPGLPMGPGEARRLWHSSADDGVGAHRAGLLPLQVHGAAATVAPATVEPADLGEGPQEDLAEVVRDLGGRVESLGLEVVQGLGQELVVSAVRAVDGVLAGQREDRADRAAFLADARVRWSVHQAGAGKLEDVLLEGPDPDQLGIDGAQQGGVGGVPVVLGGDDVDPRRGGFEPVVLGHGTSSVEYRQPDTRLDPESSRQAPLDSRIEPCGWLIGSSR